MDKVRCENLHWFDADKFSTCPHCGAQKQSEKLVEDKKEEKEKKKGLFRRRTQEENSRLSGIMADSQFQKTEVMFELEPNQVHQSVQKQEAVQVMHADIDEIKTVSRYAGVQGEEPVTGWLVGVRGEYRGISFHLKTGVNVISRDASAVVSLKKDVQVSRGKHAVIIYEPKKKIFYLGEGENTLTYCNEELVCGKQELKSYDSIEIGEGIYRFIPFCGERFAWDEEDE